MSELRKEVWVAGQQPYQEQLDRFVRLVAARAAAEEREACAVIGDERAKSLVGIAGLPSAPSTAIQRDRAKQWSMYADAIRARGQEVTK